MNDAYFAKARRHMVDSQVLPNRVNDERVIDAMASLPRELFVPSSLKSLAYTDESMPIEDGRYLMQPMVLGRLLDIAEINSADVALAIGCGTGYGVAVLAHLADTVVAVESSQSMRTKAERNLSELGIDNVAVVDGELSKGHPKEAPYDIIYIDGAVPEVPAEIAGQLADGGRLVAVECASDAKIGRAVLVTRYGDAISKREMFDAAEPVLPGFEKETVFTF